MLDYVEEFIYDDPNYMSFDDGPFPNFPGIQEFYEGKPVLTEVAQVRPGVKALDFYGCSDPAEGGTEVMFIGLPYIEEHTGSLFVEVLIGGRYGSYLSEESLMDRGIGANYNQNRWVLKEDTRVKGNLPRRQLKKAVGKAAGFAALGGSARGPVVMQRAAKLPKLTFREAECLAPLIRGRVVLSMSIRRKVEMEVSGQDPWARPGSIPDFDAEVRFILALATGKVN